MKCIRGNIVTFVVLALFVMTSCGGASRGTGKNGGAEAEDGSKEGAVSWQKRANLFLDKYFKEFETIEQLQTSSYWKAANSGKNRTSRHLPRRIWR